MQRKVKAGEDERSNPTKYVVWNDLTPYPFLWQCTIQLFEVGKMVWNAETPVPCQHLRLFILSIHSTKDQR